MDHRMLAPPHGFSQLAASFLACPRPGIPRVPLLRLTSSHGPEARHPQAPRPQTRKPVHRSSLRYAYDARRLLDDPNHPNCQKAGAARGRRRDPWVAQGCVRYEDRSAGQPRTGRFRRRGFDPVNRWSGVRAGDLLRSFQSEDLLTGSRKEVIQPQVPLRLPCYDFAPVTELAFGRSLLAVRTRTSGTPGFHGVTGGVYKARERIHRGVADPRLLAIPASCGRVAAHNPNLDRLSGIRSVLRPCCPLYRPL
jgi:hypothetical protein